MNYVKITFKLCAEGFYELKCARFYTLLTIYVIYKKNSTYEHYENSIRAIFAI